jgi:hypothetical protein
MEREAAIHPQGTGFQTGFAGSKAEAVDPEIARSQKYDDNHANDGEDVHFAQLRVHVDGARCARTPDVSAATKSKASVRRG